MKILIKKSLLSLIAIGFISNINAADPLPKLSNGTTIELLQGDTKRACEALLCLSSPTRPQECIPSVTYYFSIKFKKWSDTVNARRNFLNLCPIDSGDQKLNEYKNIILPSLEGDCSIQALNERLEKRLNRKENWYYYATSNNNGDSYTYIATKEKDIYGYRINTTPTQSCSLLNKSPYTNVRLSYTCPMKFYDEDEWEAGKEIINEISKAQYDKLNPSERFTRIAQKIEKTNNGLGFNTGKIIEYTQYFQAKPIKKDCWINKD